MRKLALLFAFLLLVALPVTAQDATEEVPATEEAAATEETTTEEETVTEETAAEEGVETEATEATEETAAEESVEAEATEETAAEEGETAVEETTAGGTLLDVAAGGGNFTVLTAAVEAAGLTELLSTEGLAYTVFAPTDEAFAAALEQLGVTQEDLLADTALLTQVLSYHVVPGTFLAADLSLLPGSANFATALGGSTVTIAINGGAVMVNEANVTQADLTATNGVIHVIDAVLLPPDAGAPATTDAAIETEGGSEGEEAAVQEGTPQSEAGEQDAAGNLPAEEAEGGIDQEDTLSEEAEAEGAENAPVDEATPEVAADVILNAAEVAGQTETFSTLVAAVGAADPAVAGVLSGSGPITVFAPSNEALQGALTALGQTPEALLSNAALTDVLLYHVVPWTYTSAELAAMDGALVGTLLPGTALQITVDGANVVLNRTATSPGVEVRVPDIYTSNGIIHDINGLLLPPGVEFGAVAAPVEDAAAEGAVTEEMAPEDDAAMTEDAAADEAATEEVAPEAEGDAATEETTADEAATEETAPETEGDAAATEEPADEAATEEDSAS